MDRKKIFLVTLGHLSCDINAGALPAALPYVRTAHNLDYQATGGIMLAYSCLASLIQPIFGLWSDNHSKPWFIPLGVAFAGCGIALLGFMDNYWAMCLAITISGIGSAFFHPEAARFANRVSGSSKGTGLSFFSIGGNSGFILGPIVVSVFAGTFGLHGLLIFAILALLMAFILLWQISIMSPLTIVSSTTNLKENAPQNAQDPLLTEADELQENKNDIIENNKNNWKEFNKLLVVIICRAIVFVGCNTFIPLYWVNIYNQSNTAGAIALVVFGASGVGFNILGGILSDRYGYVYLIRTAFCLMPPVILIFSFITNITLAYLFLPFLGLVCYLSFSSQVVLGQNLLAKNMGFASGITMGVASTLGGVAQPCLGWVADSFGMHYVFICLATLGFVGAIFSLLLFTEKKHV